MTKIKSIILISCVSIFLFSCGEEKQDKLVKKTSSDSAFSGTNTMAKSEIKDDSFQDVKLSIKLTPFVAGISGVGSSGINLLKDRLNAAISKVGYGGEGSSPRFIIGPKISIVSENVTGSAPSKFANTYEINLMVVDMKTETIFNSYSLEIKGVGNSKEKAFLNAIRSVKFNDQAFTMFLKKSEDKMIEFFENKCESIISEAEVEAKARNYSEAYAILDQIPSDSKGCFEKVGDLKSIYFDQVLEENCSELVRKMKAALGKFKDPSASGYNEEAMDYYAMIDNKSSCFPEAEKIYNKYLGSIDAKGKRDWDAKAKEQRQKRELEMAQITKESDKQAVDNAFAIKMAEIEAKAEIEGNRKLLENYKYEDSPWLTQLFSSSIDVVKDNVKELVK